MQPYPFRPSGPARQSPAINSFWHRSQISAGPKYPCKAPNIRGTQGRASVCPYRVFDRIGDATQLYFAFFPHSVGGGWIAVFGLTDASGIYDGCCSEAFQPGPMRMTEKQKIGENALSISRTIRRRCPQADPGPAWFSKTTKSKAGRNGR